MRLPASARAAAVDRRVMVRMPGREQGDALPLGKAVEVGDLRQARGRRLSSRQ